MNSIDIEIRSRHRDSEEQVASADRRGVVLVIVLLVIALLSLSAYTFTDMMLVEHQATKTYADMAQTREATMSGTALIRAFLLQDPLTWNELGGIYDNPDVFGAQPIQMGEDDPSFSAFCMVTSPAYDAQGYAIGVRNGLENESGRLNLMRLLQLSDKAQAAADASQQDADPDSSGSGAPVPQLTPQPPAGTGPATPQPQIPQPPAPPTDSGGQGTGDNSGDRGGGRDGGRDGGRGDSAAGNSGGSGGGNSGGGNSDGGMTDDGGDSDGSTDDATDDFVSTGDPGRDALMRLPGMTLEIADAILDWIDEDDIPREYGAELDYYSSIEPPYVPRNGPVNSMDELLMVRGVTPDLLYGRDQNRNGMVDQSELDQPIYAEVDESYGSIDLGWSSMLTVFSKEVAATNPNGEAKVDLNMDDCQSLVSELSAVVNADVAQFVGAYRIAGPYSGESQGKSIGSAQIDFSASPQNELTSILNLIDARVEIEDKNGDVAVYASPFQSGSLGADINLLQDYAVAGSTDVSGRININEASFAVLLAIPGMTQSVVSTIVSQRDPTQDPLTSPRRHPTWLLAEGLVDLETMREIEPLMTTGGSVFRAQVVGFYADGSGVSRAELVLDATRPDIPLLLWKDKTDLGRGFSRQELLDMSGQSANVDVQPIP